MKLNKNILYKNIVGEGRDKDELIKIKKINSLSERVLFKIIKNNKYEIREGLEYSFSFSLFKEYFRPLKEGNIRKIT